MSRLRVRSAIALAAVLAVAAFFRFDGLHWDANVRPGAGEGGETLYEEQHLHPDERFLSMVTSALEFPDSPGEYFDTAHSTLNPHNKGFGFFAYGTFPIFLTRLVGNIFDSAGYDQVHLLGRVLSATAGLFTVLLLYVFGRRLYGETVGLVGALFYGLAALPIQQAHFYTVDEFANPFVMLGLLAALLVQQRGKRRDYIAFGLALGVAMACKMPLFTLSLVVAAAAVSNLSAMPASGKRFSFDRVRGAAIGLTLAAVIAFAVFRLLQPYAFAGPGVLGMSISKAWWANMTEVRELVSGARDYPPGHQWTDRAPLWFPFRNMIAVGLGPALGLAAWAGWAVAGWELWRRRESRHLVPWLWVTIVFLHQGTQWVKSLRYLLPIYPMLALFAGWLVVRLWRFRVESATADPAARRWRRPLATATCVAIVLGAFAWAWAFTSIYRRPHSRIQASHWLYQNVPPGSSIANEVWDDPLPLRLEGRDGFSIYHGIDLHNYAEDDPRKLAELTASLDKADYLVLSSNRLYDSIPRLPMRYPMMVRYYRLLASGELGFERVAEFTSYPRLLGIDFPDQSAEEAWSVYDHPRVQIFRKTATWNLAGAREILSAGIDWGSIQRLWPRDVANFKLLVMDASLQRAQRAGGTWSRAAGGMFASDGFSARYPALTWIAVLLLLGAVGFPLAFVALPGLADRGFLVARTLGLLIVAYLSWLLASLRLVAFTRGGVWLACGIAVVIAAAAAWRSRRALSAFVASHWRLMVTEEIVFWAFFAALLAVRMANPDLWHAARGGEKPMDLAYLTAITKSTWFPPYDPWFAGGYMNYYYFGFVLTAALVKLTSIVPGVAYNLAVPTFYALMAAGAFTATAALVRALRRPATGAPEAAGAAETWAGVRAIATPGLLGAVFVAATGNLAELRLVLRGWQELSSLSVPSRIPFLPEIVRTFHGIKLWIGGQSFPFPDDWWFWSASRAIEHPLGEPPPITEFPFFTFLFADLHAHLMALPIALLVLVVVTALVVADPEAPPPHAGSQEPGAAGNWRRSWRAWSDQARREAPALAILALAVGALWPTNAWDFPTYLVLTGVGLLIVELQRRGAWAGSVVFGAGARLAVIAVGARVLFLPFSRYFATAYNKPKLWEGSRTLFSDFLTVHGVFLFFVVSWLAVRLELGRAARDAFRAARARWRWRGRRAVLSRRLRGLDSRRRRIGAWALAAVVLGIVLALARLTIEGLLAAVIVAAAIEFLARPHRAAAARFVAGMVGLAAGLALTVEHLVLDGDIGRMNTVFKSYLQIWTLWGVAAAVAATLVWTGRPRSRAWVAAASLLVAAVLMYPALATPARVRDRFELGADTGLDGERFLAVGWFHEAQGKIELRQDQEAFAWLRENVEGSPVVLEASVPPYRWGSRVSVYTGLPTVLGWDWHERQQRSVLKDESIQRRLSDVQQIYATTDLDEAMELLRRYDVRYVYVGAVEHLYYAAPGLEKFESGALGLEEVFRNSGVRIYRVEDDQRLPHG